MNRRDFLETMTALPGAVVPYKLQKSLDYLASLSENSNKDKDDSELEKHLKELNNKSLKVAEDLESDLREDPLDGLKELYLEYKLEADFVNIKHTNARIRAYLSKENPDTNLYKSRLIIDDFALYVIAAAEISRLLDDPDIPNITRSNVYESDIILKDGKFRTLNLKRKQPSGIASVDIPDISTFWYGCFYDMDFKYGKVFYRDNVGSKEGEILKDKDANGFLAESWNTLIFKNNQIGIANKEGYDWKDEGKHPFTRTNAYINEGNADFTYGDIKFDSSVYMDQVIAGTVGNGDLFFKIHNSKIRIPYIFYLGNAIKHFHNAIVSLTDTNVKYSNQVKNDIT